MSIVKMLLSSRLYKILYRLGVTKLNDKIKLIKKQQNTAFNSQLQKV